MKYKNYTIEKTERCGCRRVTIFDSINKCVDSFDGEDMSELVEKAKQRIDFLVNPLNLIVKKLTIDDICTSKNRDKRGLDDGIYDVSGLKEICLLDVDGFFTAGDQKYDDKNNNKIVDFCNRHPNWHIAAPYQTFTLFLLSEKPPKFQGRCIGSGFNYGSGNLLKDCPAKLLILAQND